MKRKSLLRVAGLAVAVGVIGGASANAVIVDVWNTGATFDVPGNTGTAHFAQDPFGSTGTGTIDPFLRLQANGEEEGMNTSSVNNYLDNKMPVDGYTRDLPLANLGTSSYLGEDHYMFFLDVNQVMNNSNPEGLISLVDLRIWISSQKLTAGELDALRATPGNVWDMNDGYDVRIEAGNGSGSGDLTVLVPIPANPSSLGSFVYLYSRFGGTGVLPSDDGFEEWRAFTSTPLPGVPDGGATLMLLGMGLSGLALIRRKLAA